MGTWVLSFFFFLASLTAALAEPLVPEDVPEPLRPWVKWVLQDHKEYECPFFYNANEKEACLWPARLELQLDARGGSFSQQWMVVAEDWIAVPGDAEHWPQEVKINGQPALVSDRVEVPSLWVQPGMYTVSGAFLWDAMPQALQVPQNVGLIALTLENRVIDFPQLDGSGEEIWVFEARPHLRQVELEGVLAIDPQQTTVPDDLGPSFSPSKLGL